MNVFELTIFLLVCVGVGLLGHLVSPRYGWLLGVLAVPVPIWMLIGGARKLRQSWKDRPRYPCMADWLVLPHNC
jgi:ABC-type transport system involved in cytochrome c biogenesis permease component